MKYIKTYEDNRLLSTQSSDFQKLIIQLKQDCPQYVSLLREINNGRKLDDKQPKVNFSQLRKEPFMLWRGVQNPKFQPGELSVLKEVRKDRMPLDMSPKLQKNIDDEFEEKFGLRPRSQGLFSTFDQYDAERYGSTILVFPIGDFKALWSDRVSDLWDTINTDFYDITSNSRLDDIGRDGFRDPRLDDFVKSLVDGYQEGNLPKLLENADDYAPANEVTIMCDKYYLVNVNEFKIMEALL